MTGLFRLGLALILAAASMMGFCKDFFQHLVNGSVTESFVIAVHTLSPDIARLSGLDMIIPAVTLLTFIGSSLLLVETLCMIWHSSDDMIRSIRAKRVLNAELPPSGL